jgi:hypothetical protein
MIKRLPPTRWGSVTRSLRRVLRRSDAAADLSSLPCVECGAPAEAWSYRSYSQSGAQVVEGAAVCQLHQRVATTRTG